MTQKLTPRDRLKGEESIQRKFKSCKFRIAKCEHFAIQNHGEIHFADTAARLQTELLSTADHARRKELGQEIARLTSQAAPVLAQSLKSELAALWEPARAEIVGLLDEAIALLGSYESFARAQEVAFFDNNGCTAERTIVSKRFAIAAQELKTLRESWSTPQAGPAPQPQHTPLLWFGIKDLI